MREALSRAGAGGSLCALITGEAGIGKTRLAEEVLASANRQGFVTATAHCYAAEGALAYAPVQSWLRAELYTATLPLLDPLWLTEVSRLMPEILIDQPDLPKPGLLSEGWQRQRFHEALARSLLTCGCPLVLFLDDLQWADRETIEWLRFLLHVDPSAPLLLLGTVRSEEVTEAHPLNAFVDAVRRDGNLVEIELGPLTAGETTTLAAQLVGCPLTSEQADVLYGETEGNPLFAVEMLRSGDLSYGAHSPVPTGLQSLPSAMRAVITRRLGQLSPEARTLAGLAATVGREFTLDVLAAADEQTDEALVGLLDELLQRRIVRERDAQHGQSTYDFSHDKIREVAYANLSVARRRILHRHVGEALAAIHAQAPDAVSAQVADHLYQAGMLADALGYYLRAAEASQRVYANANAIGYYRRALELMEREPLRSTAESREQTIAISESLGDLLDLIGQHAEAQATYERGLEIMPAKGVYSIGRARLQRKIASTFVPRHEHEAAVRAFDLADAALGDSGAELPHLDDAAWCREWLRNQADRTILYYWANQPDKIEKLVERMLPVLTRAGTALERARVYQALAYAHMRLTRYATSDELLGYAREYLAAQQELDDPVGLAYAIFVSGFVQLWHNDLDPAEHQFLKSLSLAERIGDVTTKTRCLNYLALVHRKRGDVERTRQFVERTQAAAEQAGMPEYVVQCRSNQAWIAWKQGRLAEAESIGQATLDWVAHVPALQVVNPFMWEVLFPLLDIACQAGEMARAMDLARRVLDPALQRLPDTLAGELQSAIACYNHSELDSALAHLQQSSALERQFGNRCGCGPSLVASHFNGHNNEPDGRSRNARRISPSGSLTTALLPASKIIVARSASV